MAKANKKGEKGNELKERSSFTPADFPDDRIDFATNKAKLLNAYLACHNWKQAAEMAGLDYKKIHRYKRDESFQEKLYEIGYPTKEYIFHRYLDLSQKDNSIGIAALQNLEKMANEILGIVPKEEGMTINVLNVLQSAESKLGARIVEEIDTRTTESLSHSD